MRRREHCFPTLVPIPNVCGFLSNRRSISRLSPSPPATHKTNIITNATKPSPPCKRDPSERLTLRVAAPSASLLKTDAVLATRSPGATALPEVRLSPAAAALLEKRACGSVVQQELCAADLLYFMHTEAYATRQRRRQQQEQQRSHVSSGDSASSEFVEVGLDSVRGAQTLSPSSPSFASLEARERQLADFIVGRIFPEPDEKPRQMRNDSFLENAFGHEPRSEKMSSLFDRQQKLFALRRQLAYMLADTHSTGAGNAFLCRSVGEVDRGRPPLTAVGRRAALALSLVQDILRVSAAHFNDVFMEKDGRGEVTESCNTTARKSSQDHHKMWAGDDHKRDGALTALVTQIVPFQQEHHHDSAQCAFVYRCLAQPVELMRDEVDALLTWCAGQVRIYANAVSAEIRKSSTSSGHGIMKVSRSSITKEICDDEHLVESTGTAANGDVTLKANYKKEGYSNGCSSSEVGAADVTIAQKRVLRTSGTVPPPTLRMTVQKLAVQSPNKLTAKADSCTMKSEAKSGNGWREQGPLLSPEVCENIVAAVTALLELAAEFARMSAQEVLSRNTCIAETGQHSSIYSGSFGNGDGEEEYDHETLQCGLVVRNVVDATCDTLQLLHQSCVLTSYVRHVRELQLWPLSPTMHTADTQVNTSTGTSRTLTAPELSKVSEKPEINDLCQQLSFTEAMMNSVLSCARESWLQAWQLIRQMQEWNVQLHDSVQAEFRLSSEVTHVAAAAINFDVTKGKSSATPSSTHDHANEKDSLSSLPTQTLLFLLYVFAQHGRLEEVMHISQCYLHVSAEHLLTPLEESQTRPSAKAESLDFTTSAASTSTIHSFFVHLAAANADPATAALLLSSTAALTVSNDDFTPSGNALYHYTQTDCIEAVVRAGAIPQRVLGVTEYAMLLRRMLGERLPPSPLQQEQKPQHRSIRSDEGVPHNNTVTTATRKAKKTSGSCNVGWWLSPSQVWRFSAGYPRHVRTTLCLMGFQVSARSGLAASLSVEDLYVVLSLSRQLVTRQRRKAAMLCATLDEETVESRKSCADSTSNAKEKGTVSVFVNCRCSATAQRLRREQRWSSWGVEERVPSLRDAHQQQRLPSSIPLHSKSTSTPSSLSSTEFNARLHLLPFARRVTAPCNARYLGSLCASFAAAQRGTLPLSQGCHRRPLERPGTYGATGGMTTTATAGSAVLLSLVSREMLHVLRAVHYTQHIDSYWEAALRTAAVSLQAQSSDQSLLERRTAEQVVEEVAYALARAAEASVAEHPDITRRLVAPLPFLAPYLSAFTVGALVQRPFRRALTWEQCLALLPYTPLGSRSQLWLLRRVAQDGEGRRCVFVERTVMQATSSRRSAGMTNGQRSKACGVPCIMPPAPSLLTFSQAAAQTAEQMMEVLYHARRLHNRAQRHDAANAKKEADTNSSFSSPPSADGRPTTTKSAASAVSSTRTTSGPAAASEAAADTSADADADADAALLALLLEGHWRRALHVFEHAAPRVQIGGAPHIVRLLIQADVWRDMTDAQRRPLVRLAVRSSAFTTGGGASALLEEMLRTSLEQGLWYSGLYFHQSFAAEQPELVRQCRRAQMYATQLCRGLLEKTSMTRTVAQLAVAARQSQWAAAAACFLRYATRSDDSELESTVQPLDLSGNLSCVKEHRLVSKDSLEESHTLLTSTTTTAGANAVSPTSTEELCMLISLMSGTHGGVAGDTEDVVQLSASAASKTSRAFSFFVESGGTVPAELAHVAQTVRYAMLHTPLLWMHALRWLPAATLPLPYSHEVAIRALCTANPAKLHSILPINMAIAAASDAEGVGSAVAPPLPATVASPTSPASSFMAAAATAAFSVVAEARRTRGPQHPNEIAKEKQLAVANALQVLQHAGAWEEATLLYEKAVASNCMPYGAVATVLEAAARGGAPWQVTLFYFFHMAQRLRPNVAATAVALQACAEGGQWALAFRVLQQSVLTQSAPVPRLVELALSTALHCGVWARALAAANQYRRTRDPRLAHTVLLTFVRTRHWDDAVEYFDECTRRGLRPLDASLQLAIIASEAASAEYRRTALMVGTIASALEDLYKLSGAVLEHILFVQRHVRHASLSATMPVFPTSPSCPVVTAGTSRVMTAAAKSCSDDSDDYDTLVYLKAGREEARGAAEHHDPLRQHNDSSRPTMRIFAESDSFSHSWHDLE